MNRMHKICEPLHNANILYYDAIAAEYDDILNDDEKNIFIRNAVSSMFLKVLTGGYVLDFGGGTGRDFEWLVRQQYHIVFCEPSRAMREIAESRKNAEFPDADVLFFNDEQSDFNNWAGVFPFGQKVDAVLANFAVINCIRDLDCLFEKLALALKSGGQIIALVLDDHLIKRLRANTKATIQSFFSGRTVNLFVDYKNHRQEVYIHSVRTIRKASKTAFDLISQGRLNGYGFRLIHLLRK